jgi:UDP-N-acetylglucosamine diphosphorylase / glucose-1-phosphate thymidylyltransferase / UDP-N-acetylgalactosamine diphosphorylase / glucosamine-1-phosphate N-acetyltransferase / galactosamine-1-phosphate N-acetyltransferase
MNSITVRDNSSQTHLYPFNLTRSVLDIRIGLFTIREKWQRLCPDRFVLRPDGQIPANLVPTRKIVELIENGHPEFIPDKAKSINYPWDIFRLNGDMIAEDFGMLEPGKNSVPVSPTNKTISPEKIYLEEGARVEHCILNAAGGPIYIGKNAEIMEGTMIRGPFALCENSVVKMGAKIYGGTTIGKNCVVGGEIKNAVISDNSNKAHDGYLGDSIIGEWCNLGAGTSNSNIRNTASQVMVWDNLTTNFVSAGQKCGLIMGDYSRCAINTSFNTGTVVAVSCNIFGSQLTPKHIPSFSWGLLGQTYEFEKAVKDIDSWKKLKNQVISNTEIQALKHIFELTKTNNQ